MIIEIQQPVTKEKVLDAIKTVSERTTKKTLRKHYGKLKRGLDGVNYQQQIRDEFI
ncbi:hypothetical protein [Pedobacter agri]|uniref:hypothetical protein n=1 Tax=Pedobacter agri TaxID=454586 RepID=UPI00292D659F|nr:hypothetical protein [Pedobacter agri]